MAWERDVGQFERRAAGYESGWRGRLHHEIAERAIEVALGVAPAPRRVLDVGCGSGYLLRELATRCPGALELRGVDPSPAMITVATAAARDGRVQLLAGIGAEGLPFRDGSFDLVITTTSFDHWSDQRAGIGECARVLEPGGHLVLVDLFSVLLAATLLGSRRDKARTRRRATRLVIAAGFEPPRWHTGRALIVRAMTTSLPPRGGST